MEGIDSLLGESSNVSSESNPVLSVPVRIDPEGNPIIDGEYFENNEDFKNFAAEHLKRKKNKLDSQSNNPFSDYDETIYEPAKEENINASQPIEVQYDNTSTPFSKPREGLKREGLNTGGPNTGGKSRKAKKAKKSKGGKSKKARKSLRRK